MQHQIVYVQAFPQHGLAVVFPDDSVWVTVAVRWWDLATQLWWWLSPADKKGWLILTTADGNKVRSRAIRIATRHLHIGTRKI
jgi:hypothetical protein